MAKVVEFKEGVLELLEALLDKRLVEAIISLRITVGAKAIVWSLIPDREGLSSAKPSFPAMPQSGAKVVSRVVLKSDSPTPLAAVLRPCEIRALRELSKLGQAHLQNVLIIGLECLGVFPWGSQRLDSAEETYKQGLISGEQPFGIRELCKACLHFQPDVADIGVYLVGRKQPLLVAHSPKGLKAFSALDLKPEEKNEPPHSLSLLTERRNQNQSLKERIRNRLKGLEDLVSIFGPCILCHNCRAVCPLCYCKDCFFLSATFDYQPEIYSHRLIQRKAIKLPLDGLVFHLGRMTHMASSCVGCGQCEDVCPVGIPVAQIFKVVGAEIQALFAYEPGQRLDEPLPLATFRPDELKEIET
ncbi:4Fe-4S dicluster domain-containing protein [Thermosulfuriphilus sp.]